MARFDKAIPEIILGCAAYYQQWSASPSKAARLGLQHSKLQVSLRKALKSISKLQESNYPGWSADPNNPGYLIKQELPIFLRVPVHLMPVFPTNATLDKLYFIANRVKTDDSSIIYISGSNAVREIMEYVSDIDFCEYIPKEGPQLSNSLLRKLDPTPQDVCIELKFDTWNWRAPFNDKAAIDARLRTAKASDPDKSNFKVDYVSRTDDRAYDVSVVGIVCDDQFRSEGFAKTFSYQEAQMTPTDWVPNTLSNTLELGRYVLWLIEQVKKFRSDKNYSKALKRSLSLARVCWIADASDEIKSFFDNTTILIDSELVETEKLKQKIIANCGAAWSAEVETLDRYLRDCRSRKEDYKERERRKHGTISPQQTAENVISKLSGELAKRSLGSIRL